MFFCPVDKCIGAIRDIFMTHTEDGTFGSYSVDVDSFIVEFGEFVSCCQPILKICQLCYLV